MLSLEMEKGKEKRAENSSKYKLGCIASEEKSNHLQLGTS
jgi:hypothetical protein